MLKVTIAGASGYIGSRLIQKLKGSFQIKALSRSEKTSQDPSVRWQEADLFSLTSTRAAIEGTDVAIYLVHSMMPSSRLFQGSFHDTDLMLADNFIHACKEKGVKQIIYLGGVIPEGYVSKHLESRKEVESILKSSGIPCTILRAGLVVGDGGSSFEILKNLVFNLPAMILPKWTDSNVPTIYLDDLIEVIERSVNQPSFFDKTLDVVCGEKLRYRDLIEQTVQFFKKKTWMISVPVNYTSFSKAWVTFFGRADYQLASPLVDSLTCNFSNLQPSSLVKGSIRHKTYRSMLPKISVKQVSKKYPRRQLHNNTVRSIQRLTIDTKLSAHQVANMYLSWLPKYMRPFLRVEKRDEHFALFRLLGIKKPLLVIQYIPNPEVKERVKFHVVGGFLSKTSDTGWLEFRDIDKGRFLLGSINEFIPALPWYIYKLSQAPIHKFTMNQFGKVLEQANSNNQEKYFESIDKGV